VSGGFNCTNSGLGPGEKRGQRDVELAQTEKASKTLVHRTLLTGEAKKNRLEGNRRNTEEELREPQNAKSRAMN